MTEKELSELYTRLALQFDSVLGTLVSKNLVFTDSVPGIRKDFYDSLIDSMGNSPFTRLGEGHLSCL